MSLHHRWLGVTGGAVGIMYHRRQYSVNRPDEIVLARKVGLEARFECLSDRPDIDEIPEGAPLGEICYSGILGGVPAEP